MPKQFQKESKHTRTFKNIESHHEFHHDNSGRFTTFLAVMDLYINMMMSTMPGSHGRPLWRKQLQSAWDHPDWLQLKQKGLVLKMSTDPPNSSKIRCEMEEVSAARIIFHILCSTICLSKKCGFAPSIEYVPGDLSKQNCLAQRRGNFLALEANPINWMDGLYSTHHLSNPLKIQGVLPLQTVDPNGRGCRLWGFHPRALAPRQFAGPAMRSTGCGAQSFRPKSGSIFKILQDNRASFPPRPTSALLGQRWLPTPTTSKIPVSGTQTVGQMPLL